MAALIYMLCAFTAFACAWMLLRSYARTRYRLLLWSGLCFSGMFLQNMIRATGHLILPNVDLSIIRMAIGLGALLLLLFGLIWEEE